MSGTETRACGACGIHLPRDRMRRIRGKYCRMWRCPTCRAKTAAADARIHARQHRQEKPR